ncbi:MAG TPA: hypothetical protein VFY99_04105 [Solirubrobacterales bacterium]
MGIRGTLRRLGSATLASAALALAAAAPASAASVVYIGGDGNVHLVSPDGSVKHQVTSDATADSKYRSPSQTDAGTVVAIRGSGNSPFAYFLDRQTGQVTGNWLLPGRSGPLSFSPYTGGQIAPNGGVIVYDSFYGPGYTGNGQIDVGFVFGPGATDPCVVNCETGYSEPRWIPGIPGAGMINTPFGGSPEEAIYVQGSSSLQRWVGLNNPNDADIQSFDVSRQGRTMIELDPEGAPPSGEEVSQIQFYSNVGTPGEAGADVQFQCIAENFARSRARPRWSPDGSMIAWEDAGGVFTSPAPTVTDGGPCNLAPKLVAPGGTRPDWGVADTPGGGSGSGDGGGDGGDGGDGTGGGEPTVDLGDGQSLKRVVKSGKLVVEVTCGAPCDANVTAIADKKTASRYKTGKKLGSGSERSDAAGTFDVTAKLTKKARKGLKKAKKAKATLKAEITEDGSPTETVSQKVTLKN